MGTMAPRNPNQFSLYSLFVVTLAGLVLGYSRFRPEFGIRFFGIYGVLALVFGLAVLVSELRRKYKAARKRKKR
jgi:hypothetical protein